MVSWFVIVMKGAVTPCTFNPMQPKGGKKKGKGKGKGKGKAKKESAVIDGLSTEDMSKEQVGGVIE